MAKKKDDYQTLEEKESTVEYKSSEYPWMDNEVAILELLKRFYNPASVLRDQGYLLAQWLRDGYVRLEGHQGLPSEAFANAGSCGYAKFKNAATLILDKECDLVIDTPYKRGEWSTLAKDDSPAELFQLACVVFLPSGKQCPAIKAKRRHTGEEVNVTGGPMGALLIHPSIEVFWPNEPTAEFVSVGVYKAK